MAATNPTSASGQQTPRRRVVGLLRVSTADQARDDRGGIPRQRRIVEDTIKRKNLDCLRIYEISDVSGTDVRQNADVIEILRLVAAEFQFSRSQEENTQIDSFNFKILAKQAEIIAMHFNGFKEFRQRYEIK